MRPIGFSTGALAKGDFAAGVELQSPAHKVDAVELSALRDCELPLLVDAIAELDLNAFEYVSVHAPSKLKKLDEQTVFDLLLRLPEHWPVIVHPEILETPALWRTLRERLCIENMDDRKTSGRTVEELEALFDTYPEASFCLDLGHARQIDPTMSSALRMLREFSGRLRQVHVSDVGAHGEHLPLGATARRSFAHVAHRLPAECPLIIESIVPADGIGRELESVRQALESAA